MDAKLKVSIMGGTGYAAAELIKRLVVHPHVEIVKISSIDHIGENVGKVHRNFGTRLPYIFEDLSAKELAEASDLVFLCLPHKVSYLMVPELLKHDVKIIDFSGDYRTQDAEVYNKYYKTEHTNPENLDKFVYGLPELNKELIRNAKYIANPGCFPTAVSLATLPLAKAGLLEGKVRVVGPTGSSGSGVHPSAGTHHPVRSLNLKSYKPLFHQHTPEMEQAMLQAGGKNVSVDFIPMSAPVTRGILVNCICDVPETVTEDQIKKIFEDAYANEPCTHTLPPKSYPETIAVAGTNHVQVGYSLKEDAHNGTKSLAVMACIDNLVRGASGQAVQNMNIMCGFEELTALDDFGTWP
jgi:LysW-gamma-L-alpha-aminoadipyl-6-phosphate/LysW-L-glutamyl-5-phosphate reductase